MEFLIVIITIISITNFKNKSFNQLGKENKKNLKE